MFYKKKGTPEVGDLLLCTVKRILYHSVFVSFDEYDNREGMVHISEIAPGRIRNLRDYVTGGKKIVCKVININRQTNNIDLSLRRVGTGQRMTKMNEYKQEEKAEKLLEHAGKECKLTLTQVYQQFGNQIIEQYGSIYTFFQHVIVDDKQALADIHVPVNLKEAVIKIIREKIKTPDIKISGILTLQTYSSNGIEDIKKILLPIEKEGAYVNYLGAPRYQINITAKDYKTAEHHLRELIEEGLKTAKKLGVTGEFTKSAS